VHHVRVLVVGPAVVTGWPPGSNLVPRTQTSPRPPPLRRLRRLARPSMPCAQQPPAAQPIAINQLRLPSRCRPFNDPCIGSCRRCRSCRPSAPQKRAQRAPAPWPVLGWAVVDSVRDAFLQSASGWAGAPPPCVPGAKGRPGPGVGGGGGWGVEDGCWQSLGSQASRGLELVGWLAEGEWEGCVGCTEMQDSRLRKAHCSACGLCSAGRDAADPRGQARATHI
jgi:hypothetical protein